MPWIINFKNGILITLFKILNDWKHAKAEIKAIR